MGRRAVFATPAIVTIIAGALVLSGIAPAAAAPPLSPASPLESVRVAVPDPFVGPDPVGGSSLDRLARLSGLSFLDGLVRVAVQGRSGLDDFVAAQPGAIADLLAAPPPPTEVAAWWAATPSTARVALADATPALVGGLEGLPFTLRDRANRVVLGETIDAIQAQIAAGVGRAEEDELRVRLRMLDAVRESLRTGPTGARRTLIALDVSGEGRAVVGLGDLSGADYVTYYVPGMYVGITGQLVDWVGNAETGLAEQRTWMERLGIRGTAATIAWIGYRTPTIASIASLDLAYQGRDALTASLQGLDAVRATVGSRDAHVSLVAHSYGSTAAMLALQENDVTVDTLIMVGSPGSPATSVADLKVAGGDVWVAAADSDPVPWSGVFGSQPLDPDFGAHTFSVRGTTDPITGQRLSDIAGHVYYFWPGTTAVRNTALIAIGAGDLATTDAPATKAVAR